MSLEQSTFYWRHATIAPDVEYPNVKFFPLDIYNGCIVSWQSPNGLYPFSYPKNASPIFSSGSISMNTSGRIKCDKHNFWWAITEEEAREFLRTKYPKIYEQYQNQ
jgi:hypothetical protein